MAEEWFLGSSSASGGDSSSDRKGIVPPESISEPPRGPRLELNTVEETQEEKVLRSTKEASRRS
jgi:hypothetical protein